MYYYNNTMCDNDDVEFIYEFVEQELPFTQVFNMYNPDIEIEQ